MHTHRQTLLPSQSLRQWKGQRKPIIMITNMNITHQTVRRGWLGVTACRASDIYKINCRPHTEEIKCDYTWCDAGSLVVWNMTNLILDTGDWHAGRKLDNCNWKHDEKGDAGEADADRHSRRRWSVTRWAKTTTVKVSNGLVSMTGLQIQYAGRDET